METFFIFRNVFPNQEYIPSLKIPFITSYTEYKNLIPNWYLEVYFQIQRTSILKVFFQFFLSCATQESYSYS